MSFTVTARDVLDLQQAIQSVGQPISYVEAGESEARELKARVRYLNATELANSIESYPLEVTLDARDFAARKPRKGDAIVIDGARRGVMLVREVRGSGRLISFRCGVQG